jgi:hypothetical protein
MSSKESNVSFAVDQVILATSRVEVLAARMEQRICSLSAELTILNNTVLVLQRSLDVTKKYEKLLKAKAGKLKKSSAKKS